jgi:septal ring factor EnvC (AmiA/AmiB activator)
MVLSAFLLGLVVSLAATAFAVVRAVALFRQAKRTGRALSTPLSAFEEKAAEVDRHLDAFEASSRELERAVAQLRSSRARLQVLLDSLERSRSRLHWLRVFLPAR